MIKVKNPSTGEIETHTARQDFSLSVPPMVSITFNRRKAYVKDACSCVITIENPLDYPLQNASLTVEANGLFTDRNFTEQTLEPKTTYQMNFDFIPEKSGKYTVLIDIDSREIQDIKTDATFEVLE
ncbi:Oidioi.mRNA.OKI2018_I69.chr1.g1764.t1.cds [Oikopleura dioica]|uniref:Oidioi.mRNA.OKI2018_I69.chr1.g1764.t1.cds n=1 Tax=Oikopleura dioica TaxID=34765 RepID=A0ABN7SSR3_OIKDI|nr:Oidioi.mRNA.OKI2018_I69.chr1.g1764.t1.cds [Oikopleura dioica]